MTEPIGCREAVERLWAFLDGHLDEHDTEAVEAHLAFCLRCCGELAFAQELRRLLQIETSTELPEDVRTRLEAFIDELEHPRGEEAWR